MPLCVYIASWLRARPAGEGRGEADDRQASRDCGQRQRKPDIAIAYLDLVPRRFAAKCSAKLSAVSLPFLAGDTVENENLSRILVSE